MPENLRDLYSLVIPAAPYVIGAYGLLWISLAVYVGLVFKRLGALEKQLEVVEETVAARKSA